MDTEDLNYFIGRVWMALPGWVQISLASIVLGVTLAFFTLVTGISLFPFDFD